LGDRILLDPHDSTELNFAGRPPSFRLRRHTSTDPTLRSKSTYRCVFNALNWPGIGPHGIQNLSLLDYLRQQNWTTRPIAHGSEFVGFCPLYPDTGPSFYVDSSKKSLLLSRLESGPRPPSLCPGVPPSVLPPQPRLPPAAK